MSPPPAPPPDPEGHGDIRLDNQAAATQASNVFRRNKLLSTPAMHSSEPSGTLQAARNYWGAAAGPAPGRIQGSGQIVYAPFYKDEAMETLDFGALPVTGIVTLGAEDSVDADQLSLAGGAELIVRGGSIAVRDLVLAPGAVLEVVNGDLSLDPSGAGEYHTLSGSFTFFDCLGSLHINGNTSFSGSTLGIVSDIHIAPGVTLLVLGSLTLDGCTLTSTGHWNLLVNLGATFRMVRCEATNGFISLAGSDVLLRDNLFSGTALTAFGTVSGAAVLHNILTGGSHLTILPGASITTSGEGWGNVSSPTLVENALTLNFRPPLNPTRTLDSAGNLYVQPGDPVAAGLDISRLNVKAQAAEVLLGFNSSYLGYTSLSPSSVWSNDLHAASDESAVIGKLNAAVGLGFAFPDPDGTTLDSQVADVMLVARALEGTSSFFFRQKSAADPALIDTRITTSSGGVPDFRSLPFTRNAATLIVDGTIPVFHSVSSATQVQNGAPADVTNASVITHQGTVTVIFDAADQLAGVDDTDVSVTLNGTAGTVSGILTGTVPVLHSGLPFTRYTFEVTIAPSTPNGEFNIDAAVMDRSGNLAVMTIGALQIQKNQIAVTVQPQGLMALPVSRNVVFTATDSLGSILAVWDVPVTFTAGTGSVTLLEVPGNTTSLSAKMAWNLRVRLPATLDAGGQGAVAFTGLSRLPGGDLNGDNLVNLADYNIMRFSFPGTAPGPDITADGQTNLADYNILRANWLTVGGPQ